MNKNWKTEFYKKMKKKPLLLILCVQSHFSPVWLFVTLMDCNPPGSSVHGILQARVPEWVVISNKETPGRLTVLLWVPLPSPPPSPGKPETLIRAGVSVSEDPPCSLGNERPGRKRTSDRRAGPGCDLLTRLPQRPPEAWWEGRWGWAAEDCFTPLWALSSPPCHVLQQQWRPHPGRVRGAQKGLPPLPWAGAWPYGGGWSLAFSTPMLLPPLSSLPWILSVVFSSTAKPSICQSTEKTVFFLTLMWGSFCRIFQGIMICMPSYLYDLPR